MYVPENSADDSQPQAKFPDGHVIQISDITVSELKAILADTSKKHARKNEDYTHDVNYTHVKTKHGICMRFKEDRPQKKNETNEF